MRRLFVTWLLGAAMCHAACGRAPASSVPAPAPAPSGVSARPPARVALPRSWRVEERSPFHLVGEQLRGARFRGVDLTVLSEGRTVISTRECASSATPTLTFRAVDADVFTPPIPAVPLLDDGEQRVSGYWPGGLMVLFPHAREPSRREAGALMRYDGTKWREILAPNERPSTFWTQPFDVLPWFDGAFLVAQTWPPQDWGAKVLPFLLEGKSSRPVPDFSVLNFPKEQIGHAAAIVKYGSLSTHELFVLHRAIFMKSNREIVALARSSAAGDIKLETLLDTPTGAFCGLASGRLGDREVMVVWMDRIHVLGRVHHPLLRVYDTSGPVELGAGFDLPRGGPVKWVWLAGGKLWLRRGKEVLRFDGGVWSKFLSLPTEQPLIHEVQSGHLWSLESGKPVYYDAAAERHEVPWLVGEQLPVVRDIVAVSRDDVWLVAETAEQESLVFRTKAMKDLLTCD